MLANEPALVKRARVEPAAFAAIYDHYFASVYNYLRYRVHDPDVVDDLTASVFESALTKLSSYRPGRAPFATWLFGIARHAVTDHFRAKRRRRWLSLDILRERAGDGPDPEHQAINAEAREGVLTAVSRLSERERDIVGLKFAAGLSNRRIAELTDLNEGNVAVIVYRAIRRLRKELRAEERTS